MPEVRACHMDDTESFNALCKDFSKKGAKGRFDRLDVRGEEVSFESEPGVTKLFWIYSGKGEVFLPRGFRAKEGDGHHLPNEYESMPMSPHLRERIEILSEGIDKVSPPAQPIVQGILARVHGDAYVGDFANELWRLTQIAKPWASDTRIEEAFRYLYLVYRDCGYSLKSVDSFEHVTAGDQLAVSEGESLRVRGRFSCLTLECSHGAKRHIPAVMRLRYLRDTAGGCNFDFDPFRKLPLTWYVHLPGESGDGVNFANSHVVNIAKETSPTHFHPSKAVGGGSPQHEFYLVLDPSNYGLKTYGRHASLIVYPNLRNLAVFEQHELKPGSFVHIPPGTGHRGIDVFVNVITLPGFKPHNEFYIDKDVRDATNGDAPCNESLLGLKNYASLLEFL